MQDKIIYENIKKKINELDGLRKEDVFDYFKTLTEPETYSGIRIPSRIRLPSITFQQRYTTRIISSKYGFFCVSFNPWFLASNDLAGIVLPLTGATTPENLTSQNWVSTMWSNDDTNRTGYETLATLSQVDPIQVNNQIPPIINAYRLVSASMKLKWLYRNDITSGVFKGGICLANVRELAAIFRGPTTTRTTSVNEDMRRMLSNGQNIEKLFYYRCNPVLEGIRLLYFPVGNEMLEYKRLLTRDNFKSAVKLEAIKGWTRIYFHVDDAYWNSNFNWVVCMLEGYHYQTYSTEIEICCNYEGLLTPECLGYIPQEIETKGITIKTLSSVIELMKDICLQSENSITFNLLNNTIKINNINNI